MRRSRQKASPANYLDAIPARAIDYEVDEAGRVILLRPKFMKGILARFLQPRIKFKYFRVKLDEFGSKTWEAIDGNKNIAEVADALYDAFGDAVEPRYERVAKFIHSLHQGAMVTLRQNSLSKGT